MTDPIGTVEGRHSAIVEMLPDDPQQKSSEILTHAAVVCISAGVADEDAIQGLRAALGGLRERGLGEERH